MAGNIEAVQSCLISTEPSVIFATLADGATWPSWTPISSFRLDREAPGGGEGVGAVRAFNSGLTGSLEETLRCDEPDVFEYRLLKSKMLHVRDYTSKVSLTEQDGGTLVTWTGSFRPLFPGSGWLWRRIIGGFYQKSLVGLDAYLAGGASESAD